MTRDALAMELLKSLVMLPLTTKGQSSNNHDSHLSIQYQTSYAIQREERVKLAYLYADEVIKQVKKWEHEQVLADHREERGT